MKKLITYLIPLFLIIIVLNSCAGSMGYTIKDDYNKDTYKRIGLIVIRIGTKYPYNSPEEITLQTDYSIKDLSTAKDINIEDQAIIKEALITYPSFEEFTVLNYFKNITSRIYESFHSVLSEKGYDIYNTEELLDTMDKNISDMNVTQIIDSIKSDVDAIVIVHYVDIGQVNAQAVHLNGFNGLLYRIAMFDVNTNEIVLSYAVHHNHFSLLDSYANDPELASKVTVQKDIFGDFTGVSHTLTEDEKLDSTLKYMMNGLEKNFSFSNKGSSSWQGLITLFP